VRAPEHRVFVLDGRALFSYHKRPPSVVGDGRTPLRELIAALRRENARARDEAGRLMALDETPAAGQRLTLDGPANRSAGGGSHDLRDGAPEPMARLAAAAADALGLRLAGVDLFDLSPAGDGGELAVIEVNSNPMIATLEDHGRWDLIVEIWRANFAAALK
jgi:D-alanine-D-alanine ligase-like ATP-grasp enzyme